MHLCKVQIICMWLSQWLGLTSLQKPVDIISDQNVESNWDEIKILNFKSVPTFWGLFLNLNTTYHRHNLSMVFDFYKTNTAANEATQEYKKRFSPVTVPKIIFCDFNNHIQVGCDLGAQIEGPSIT